MVRQQLFIGAALIAGVAIGYFVQPEPVAPTAPAEKASPASRAIEDKGESASIAALRARVRELEAKLAEKERAKTAEPVAQNEVARVEPERGDRGRGSPREWLENLRKTDPARYEQMTNRFARMRQDRKSRQQARSEFLASVDTSHMSEGARKTHAAYQDLLAQREELEEKLHNPDLPDEERRSLMDEMFALGRQMRQSADSERQVLLGEVAKAIGLEGAAATELVETVKDVVEVTESGFGGGRHGPPPPPQGPAQ